MRAVAADVDAGQRLARSVVTNGPLNDGAAGEDDVLYRDALSFSDSSALNRCADPLSRTIIRHDIVGAGAQADESVGAVGIRCILIPTHVLVALAEHLDAFGGPAVFMDDASGDACPWADDNATRRRVAAHLDLGPHPCEPGVIEHHGGLAVGRKPGD